MRITIIGWYGTETIGDRAILAGIISVFSKMFGSIEINIGSIFPFFTERTVKEDASFWTKINNNEINIKIFDSKKHKILNEFIKKSEILVMGGGPLMHINEMFMIDYAFKKAKNLSTKTIVLGSGIGPIFNKKYHNCLLSILKNSDIVYLRDNTSIHTLKNIVGANSIIDKKNIFISHDPATIPCLYYNENYIKKEENNIAINLRDFSSPYSKNKINITETLINFLDNFSKYDNSEIKLIPMSYFSAGGDDREYFYQLLTKLKNRQRYSVQDVPLNIEETLSTFSRARLNIGMRYHSIVFQTLVSGNNYILDYTEPNIGKISGFLKDIDKAKFYTDRYINLQESKLVNFKFSTDKFKINLKLKDVIENSYSEIKKL